jgi:hypothetical protein
MRTELLKSILNLLMSSIWYGSSWDLSTFLDFQLHIKQMLRGGLFSWTLLLLNNQRNGSHLISGCWLTPTWRAFPSFRRLTINSAQVPGSVFSLWNAILNPTNARNRFQNLIGPGPRWHNTQGRVLTEVKGLQCVRWKFQALAPIVPEIGLNYLATPVAEIGMNKSFLNSVTTCPACRLAPEGLNAWTGHEKKETAARNCFSFDSLQGEDQFQHEAHDIFNITAHLFPPNPIVQVCWARLLRKWYVKLVDSNCLISNSQQV